MIRTETDPPLAFVVKRFPRLSETFILNEFLELRRQGVDVRLFAIMDSAEKLVQPGAEQLRAEVCYLRSGPRLPRWARITRSLVLHRRGLWQTGRALLGHHSRATIRHIGEALVLLDSLGPVGARHVHAHFAHSPAAVAFHANLLSGVPFSFTAHAKDLYTTPAQQVLRRCEVAEFVVTCTEANARYLEDVVGARPDKVVVCRHGVDLSLFLPLARTPVPGRVLSVGRLVPKKGFDTLVRACGLLHRRGVAHHCRIIGDGPLRDELSGLVTSLGIEDQVELAVARPQPELLEEYAQAEIFALSPTVMENGDRDGVPNVLLEAMAAAVPVVSTLISGIPEVVQDGRTGRLVPPDDPVQLADALQALLSSSETRQRLGEEARNVVSERFDLATCVEPLVRQFAAGASIGRGVAVRT